MGMDFGLRDPSQPRHPWSFCLSNPSPPSPAPDLQPLREALLGCSKPPLCWSSKLPQLCPDLSHSLFLEMSSVSSIPGWRPSGSWLSSYWHSSLYFLSGYILCSWEPSSRSPSWTVFGALSVALWGCQASISAQLPLGILLRLCGTTGARFAGWYLPAGSIVGESWREHWR